MAIAIGVSGCGKKQAATGGSMPSIKTNYSLIYTHSDEIAHMHKMVDQCQVIAYAITDTNNATNIIFTVSEIWKGTNQAAALGITNGTQFSSSSVTVPNRDTLDGGLVFIPTVFYDRGVRQVLSPSEAVQKRFILPEKAGRFDGMTIKEYKDMFGL